MKSEFLCALLVAAVSAALWRAVESPITEGPAPELLGGISFSPLERGQSPEHELPSLEQLDADLALISRHTKRFRTYAIDGELAQVPALARRHELEVTLGIALDPREWPSSTETNAARLRRLAEVVASNANVTRVIVGNESILAGDWTVAELAVVLDDLEAGFGLHLLQCARDVVADIAATGDDDAARFLLFMAKETEGAAGVIPLADDIG